MTLGEERRAAAAGHDAGAAALDLGAVGIAELFSLAEARDGLASPSPTDLYAAWIAAHAGDPLLHAVYFNYGVALAKSGDRAAAAEALKQSIGLNPDFAQAYINLGRVLEDAGQAGEAVSLWLTLLGRLSGITGETVKHKLLVLTQIGRVLETHNEDGAAEDALRQALEIRNDQPEVAQHWIALRQRQCKWPPVEGSEHIAAERMMASISPLSLATLKDDPMFALARAAKYNREAIKVARDARGSPEIRRADLMAADKLRIGYVSSDLREHAVGFAMTDVIEQHDRAGFEIFTYYCGIPRVDATQNRIRQAASSWADINGLTDAEAAHRIAADRIHILVDLNGYTMDARTGVFALRPAPIAVNWFGFPGTMGSPYHHYLIADEIIVPESAKRFYSEHVVHLPCYQPNDRKRVVDPVTPPRAEEGLPEDAVVFCCLNGTQKITPAVFQGWMRILAEVPRGVLWLLGGTEDTNGRLRLMAQGLGIAPDRLIFAKKKPNPQHLARYRLADLFLDTFPYGAHTTAADALWMGVPVLTLRGTSFAARVCASVVTAAGLGELVTASFEDYVARAIALGRDRSQIEALKARLKTGRDTSLLFDTTLLVRKLENLYRGMWHAYASGQLPEPDLTNLDVYHEIGVEVAVAEPDAAAPFDVERHYRERLADRDRARSMPPDARLWRGNL